MFKKILIGLGVPLMVATATACGTTKLHSVSATHKVPRLQQAYRTCATERQAVVDNNGGTVELADSGNGLIFSGLDSDTGTTALACILNEVGTSATTIADMDATNALMGRQSATEDGLSYQWSYHPDNGINMTITESN